MRSSAIYLLLLVLSAGLRAQTMPPIYVPPLNPITEEKRVLGKILFWEEQLSTDMTVACGTCHIPSAGGGDPRTGSSLNPGKDQIFGTPDDIHGSPGVVRMDQSFQLTPDGIFGHGVQVTGRKAPSNLMSALDQKLFWDGRAEGVFNDPETGEGLIGFGVALEIQALGPLLSEVEMACELRTYDDINDRLQTARPMRLATNIPPDMAAAIAANPSYPQLFQAAFGDPMITAVRIAYALATYQRTLIPDQSPYDLYYAGNTSALTQLQRDGDTIFNTSGLCAFCHIPGPFMDDDFHDIGVRPAPEDLGRGAITGNPTDQGKMKTPSIRNVSLRAPFFRNGSIQTLMDVVEFYEVGGHFTNNPNFDTLMQPLSLSSYDKAALVALLEALTDPRVANESFPFDRPTLRSENSWPTQALGPGSAGSGGIVPRLVSHFPPMIGTPLFGVGVAGGLGGAPAVVAFGPDAAPPGTTLLGSPLYLDPSSQSLFFQALQLQGAPGVPGEGYGDLLSPIPDHPGLAGLSLIAQWFIVDAGHPGGLAVTEGQSFTFFAP